VSALTHSPTRPTLLLTAAAALVLTILGTAKPSHTEPAVTTAGTVVDAVAVAMRSSVIIQGDGIFGSGIVVDPMRGLVLTSFHVVEEMKSPRVETRDGRKSAARVLVSDKALDIAILSAPDIRSDSPPPRFADAAMLHPGEEIFAIGMPRKLPFSVSRGIVSYVGRQIEGARYLQVDMSINDGNSGGPVFNSRGEIVGVMSFILRRSQGLAFALPVTEAMRVFKTHMPTTGVIVRE
jgi:serine protease Do